MDSYDYDLGTAERITFHFEGDLADRHVMNFYESARFQYAAARLVTKLARFQVAGKFPQKITNRSNTEITLEAHSEGSFDITILAPLLPIAAEVFMTTPISGLMSYVFERLITRSDSESVISALNSQDKVVETLGHISDNNTQVLTQALDIISRQNEQLVDGSRRREEHLEQRIAELHRERMLDAEGLQLTKIDDARGQKLLAMGAPLIKEMATALRTSASSLDIISESEFRGRNNILYLNKRLAKEIETSEVDDDITSIRVDIVQYNKESGWGKVRLHLTGQLLPFTVPSDRKERLRLLLTAEMAKRQTFIQAYFVRDRAGDLTRLVIVGIIPEVD